MLDWQKKKQYFADSLTLSSQPAPSIVPKKLDKVMNVKAQLYPEKMATLNILPERPRIGFSILREH